MVKFQKQPMMRKVLISLVPLVLHSLWLYGVRAAAVLLVTFFFGIVTEHLFERKKPNGKVSEAVLVTCALFALSMPPAVPLWIVAVGIVFAVFMAKEVYGGFARNVFNPAISGRLFVYISFAAVLGKSFVPAGAFGTLGGRFWTGTLAGQPDVISAATPLAVMRGGGSVDLWSLLTGFRVGSIGEGSIILIAAAAIYLIATKTASWRIILSASLGALITAAALLYGGVSNALPLESLLSGSLAFMIVFMATDPVTAPKRPLSLILYGLMIGSITIFIRQFSAFPEATSFGILLGNVFASMIDKQVNAFRKKPAVVPTSAVKEGPK